MPREHRVIRIKGGPGFDLAAGIAPDHLTHKNKGRAMGKAKKVTSDV
jgi:hypothetical protein